MKTGVFLRDPDLLPPITEDDKKFAEDVCGKYPELVFKGICWLARDVRHNVSYDWRNEDLTEYAKALEKLFDPDIKFEKISIASNKGILNIKATDPFFNYFLAPIRRIKRKYKGELKYLYAAFNQGAKDASFETVADYFNKTNLGPFQKRVAIGMFLVHFKLFARDPIPTKKQWDNNPTNALGYRHYLSEIVKTRLKTF